MTSALSSPCSRVLNSSPWRCSTSEGSSAHEDSFSGAAGAALGSCMNAIMASFSRFPSYVAANSPFLQVRECTCVCVCVCVCVVHVYACCMCCVCVFLSLSVFLSFCLFLSLSVSLSLSLSLSSAHLHHLLTLVLSRSMQKNALKVQQCWISADFKTPRRCTPLGGICIQPSQAALQSKLHTCACV